jgi:plasmid stabilization system protein ParE
MAFKVEWTDNAKENIRDITSYLLDNWSFEIAEKFTDNLIEQTLRLERMPFLGKEHSELGAVRKLPIPPHNILYYTILSNQIIVLNILDSRKQKQ